MPLKRELPQFRMQFHICPPHHDPIIRRIPTIRLQTMKHIQENCMRNFEGGGAKPPEKSHVMVWSGFVDRVF